MNDKYRGRELSLEEFEAVLSNRLFSHIQLVNLNGGEPNLRDDLVGITEMLIQRFPRLQAISLNSNGIPPQKTAENVERMATLCRRNGIRFSVSISLHKIGDGLDQIAGIRNAFERIAESFRLLKALNRHDTFFLSANCVITNLNLHGLPDLVDWGRRENIPVNFVLGEIRDRFGNAEMENDITIQEKDRPYLVAFLRNLAKSKGTHLHHALRYRHLADMVEQRTNRSLACHYYMGGVILGSDGSLYYCKHSPSIGDCQTVGADEIYFDEKNLEYRRQRLKNGLCQACPPNTYNRMEIEKDLPKVVRYLLIGR